MSQRLHAKTIDGLFFGRGDYADCEPQTLISKVHKVLSECSLVFPRDLSLPAQDQLVGQLLHLLPRLFPKCFGPTIDRLVEMPEVTYADLCDTLQKCFLNLKEQGRWKSEQESRRPGKTTIAAVAGGEDQDDPTEPPKKEQKLGLKDLSKKARAALLAEAKEEAEAFWTTGGNNGGAGKGKGKQQKKGGNGKNQWQKKKNNQWQKGGNGKNKYQNQGNWAQQQPQFPVVYQAPGWPSQQGFPGQYQQPFQFPVQQQQFFAPQQQQPYQNYQQQSQSSSSKGN